MFVSDPHVPYPMEVKVVIWDMPVTLTVYIVPETALKYPQF